MKRNEEIPLFFFCIYIYICNLIIIRSAFDQGITGWTSSWNEKSVSMVDEYTCSKPKVIPSSSRFLRSGRILSRGTRLSIESRLQFCRYSFYLLFSPFCPTWIGKDNGLNEWKGKKKKKRERERLLWKNFGFRNIVKLLSSLFHVRLNTGLASFPEAHGNWSVNFCKVSSAPPCPIKRRNICR